jgi:hypothetical protein
VTRRVLVLALLSTLGCASRPVATNPAFDLSKVRRVAVLPFEGTGGPAVTNEFIRHLVAGGVTVTDTAVNIDAVLTGTVTDYRAGNKTLIFLGETPTMASGGQTVVVTNPVVSIAGSPGAVENATVGAKNAQVVAVSAAVGVVARLRDPVGNRAVWAQDFAYEALDLPTALQATVTTLSEDLLRALAHPAEPAGGVR